MESPRRCYSERGTSVWCCLIDSALVEAIGRGGRMGWSIDFKQEGGKEGITASRRSLETGSLSGIEENVVRYIMAKPMWMQK